LSEIERQKSEQKWQQATKRLAAISLNSIYLKPKIKEGNKDYEKLRSRVKKIYERKEGR